MTSRRSLIALASVLALVGTSAHAQSAAEKQLASDKFTLVAPFPAGGPIDTLARVLADGLAKRYNQVAVVDNAPGAAGNIGMDKVKRGKPDGHTLLVIPAGNLTVNPTLMPKFPFDIQKDFVPVAMLAKTPNVLVTNPATGIKTVAELIAQAKAKPDSPPERISLAWSRRSPPRALEPWQDRQFFWKIGWISRWKSMASSGWEATWLRIKNQRGRIGMR